MAKRDVVTIWVNHRYGKVNFTFIRQNSNWTESSSKTYSLETISGASLRRIEIQLGGAQYVNALLSKNHQAYGHMFYEDTY